MGNAENCGSMRSTTMDSPASGDLSSYVTGLLVIMHCLFAHLTTGGHSSTYHSKTKDTLTPTLRQSTSFGDVPGIYGSGIGLSATPVALWSALASAITRGIPTAYGPVASSRSGTSRFGILEPFWPECDWTNIIGCRDAWMRSSGKRKDPARAGCVCVEHLNRCKISTLFLLLHT